MWYGLREENTLTKLGVRINYIGIQDIIKIGEETYWNSMWIIKCEMMMIWKAIKYNKP